MYMCVCACVEMIDCGQSDNMIEICGKLDKSSQYSVLKKFEQYHNILIIKKNVNVKQG